MALNLQIKLIGFIWLMIPQALYSTSFALYFGFGSQPEQLSPIGGFNIAGNEVSNQGGTSFGPNPLPSWRRFHEISSKP
jgi:hypothetical protein